MIYTNKKGMIYSKIKKEKVIISLFQKINIMNRMNLIQVMKKMIKIMDFILRIEIHIIDYIKKKLQIVHNL